MSSSIKKKQKKQDKNIFLWWVGVEFDGYVDYFSVHVIANLRYGNRQTQA